MAALWGRGSHPFLPGSKSAMRNSKHTRSDQPEVLPRLDPCVSGVAPRRALSRTASRQHRVSPWRQRAYPAGTGVRPQESSWCRSPCLAWSPPALMQSRTGPGWIRTCTAPVPGVNYLGGSRQLRRRVPPSLPLPWQGEATPKTEPPAGLVVADTSARTCSGAHEPADPMVRRQRGAHTGTWRLG
jgi:hypothetical protein